MVDKVHDRDEWLARRAAEQDAAREAKRQRWREEHEAELERRRLERQAERLSRRGAHELARTVTPTDPDARFEEQMANRLNLTVVEFRELQARQRAEIENRPAITYSPDHTVH